MNHVVILTDEIDGLVVPVGNDLFGEQHHIGIEAADQLTQHGPARIPAGASTENVVVVYAQDRPVVGPAVQRHPRTLTEGR